MKIIKRNQLIVLVISLMLITAGYLNFTANNESDTREVSGAIADLGDAMLVNNSIEGADEENEENAVTNEPQETIDNTIQPQNINRQQSNLTPSEQYFVRSKLERETMYSQMLEVYQQVYNNTNATSEERTEALRRISEVNQIRNSIMIAENLLIAMGFADIVIFANSNSTSIVVRADELAPEQIAQIQNIVSRELNVEISTMRISTK